MEIAKINDNRGCRIQKVITNEFNTIFVGMDVHKEKFSLCCYSIEKDEFSHLHTTATDYKHVFACIVSPRGVFGENASFLCGYEARCLGFTLYHQLTEHNVNCVILVPTTMPIIKGKKKTKTDKRDARNIAKCLAHHAYSPVHIPTEQDEQVKEYIRMRTDHKLTLKKIKQQILVFCLRHNLRYGGKSHWTAAHVGWLKSLKPEDPYEEILKEYLLTFENLTDKIERLDKRIDELAAKEEYGKNVKKLFCFLGVQIRQRFPPLLKSEISNGSLLRRNLPHILGLFPERIPAVTVRQGLA